MCLRLLLNATIPRRTVLGWRDNGGFSTLDRKVTPFHTGGACFISLINQIGRGILLCVVFAERFGLMVAWPLSRLSGL